MRRMIGLWGFMFQLLLLLVMEAGVPPAAGAPPADPPAEDFEGKAKALEAQRDKATAELARVKIRLAASALAKTLGVADVDPLLELVPVAEIVYDAAGVPTNLETLLTTQRDRLAAALGSRAGSGGGTRPAPAAKDTRIPRLSDPGLFGAWDE